MLLFISGESIREIIEDAGCEIWYLPAYSPDLNRIALLKIGGLF